jgi:hypothetical protein
LSSGDKKTDDTLKFISSAVAPYGFFTSNWIAHKNITKSLRAMKERRQTCWSSVTKGTNETGGEENKNKTEQVVCRPMAIKDTITFTAYD